MPNHIKNRLEFEGSEEDIRKLIETYSTHYEAAPNISMDGKLVYKRSTGEGKFDYEVGWLDEESNTFSRREKDDVIGVPQGFEIDMEDAWTRFPDFNKIIPMPDSLNIDHTSLGTMAQTLLFGTGGDDFLGFSEMHKRMRELNDNHKKEAVELALKYQSNLDNYGYTTWYQWAPENWGTKWNAYSCEEKGNYYFFETAWAPVPLLIREISKAFPKVKIIYKYADEDTGYKCGSAVYLDGSLTINRLRGGSKEAYDIAFELHPDRKEDYELVGDEYQYREEV